MIEWVPPTKPASTPARPVLLANYVAQERAAIAWMDSVWKNYFDAGYVEVAPGILLSPDGKTVVSV